MRIPETYELIETVKLAEIGATGYRLSHKKTGARVILVETEDDNKVFNIAFRTTPDNSEGTPHITEHSVLCGSDRYPVKDPFIELAKGSLNTFLNAMTWPDKTAYPIGSRNQADFRNLMGVYMDAVFCPNTYKTDKILKQEGWHYELDSKDGELKLNGVVYNEMRGAYSDPDNALENTLTRSIFPGTTYAVDSGGNPKYIPDLTQEKFLAFHKKFYHPSNSYIFLYGDLDFEERLNWMDAEYLDKYDRLEMDTRVTKAVPFETMQDVEETFSVSADDTETGAIFSETKIVDGLFDPVEYVAFQVLGYALLNAPGAPLREALVNAGIGSEIYGGYESGYLQPVFSVNAKNCKAEDFDKFKECIETVLKNQVKEGINKKTLLAGINNIEFSLREADFGSTPRGLVYWMQMAETWIHDDEKPFIHLLYNDTFVELKKLVETDYFENLVRTRLLENGNGVAIRLTPEPGKTEKDDNALKEKLAAYKASLSDEELERIIRETKELKAYQEAPTSEEDLEKIPLLSLSEISEDPKPTKNEVREIEGVKTLFHDIVTSGIGYVDALFPITDIKIEELPYVGLLKGLFTQMATKKHSYKELNDEISFYTGGLGASTVLLTDLNDKFTPYFTVSVRYLRENVSEAIGLLTEVFSETSFEDTKRLKDLLLEQHTDLKDGLENAGHRTAMRRVLSYSLKAAYEEEYLSGIDYFEFIDDLKQNFDEKKDALIAKLAEVASRIFKKDGAVISVTGEEADYEAAKKALPAFIGTLSEDVRTEVARDYKFEQKNEALKTSALVQYVAAGGNMKADGGRVPNLGTMNVLRTLMSYEYLWQNVRVLGGAYGCMMQYGRDGRLAFCSYRDPNLRKTYDVFNGIPDYLRTLTLSERDLTKYIIGTVGSIDHVELPPQEGKSATSMYLCGITDEYLKKNRVQVLKTTQEDLRGLADSIEKVLKQNSVMCVGNETVITENKDTFKVLRTL